MNPGELSVRNDRVVILAMLLAAVGGIVAYINIGRLEDPEFTIKQALIITPYPGASAEEVAQEVTNPIETACQQLGQLDYVESESSRGRSVVSVNIKDRYDRHRIPQVWDELRRKIADVQPQLAEIVARLSRVRFDEIGTDLQAALKAVNRATVSLQTTLANADTSIRQLTPEAQAAVADMRQALAQANQTLASAQATLRSAEANVTDSQAPLQRNANHMGNCTFSYRTRCENGQAFIGHLAYEDGEYNFAILARRMADGSTMWTAGEMNSRFNRGNVPQIVRTQLTRMIDSLNN